MKPSQDKVQKHEDFIEDFKALLLVLGDPVHTLYVIENLWTALARLFEKNSVLFLSTHQ